MACLPFVEGLEGGVLRVGLRDLVGLGRQRPLGRLEPAKAPQEPPGLGGVAAVAPRGTPQASHLSRQREVARHAGQLHVGRRLGRRVRLHVGETLLTVAGEETAAAISAKWETHVTEVPRRGVEDGGKLAGS